MRPIQLEDVVRVRPDAETFRWDLKGKVAGICRELNLAHIRKPDGEIVAVAIDDLERVPSE